MLANRKITLILALICMFFMGKALYADEENLSNPGSSASKDIFMLWDEYKNMEQSQDKDELRQKITETLISGKDLKKFVDEKFLEVIKNPYDTKPIWQIILRKSPETFLASIADDENIDITVKNWAKVLYIEDISELDRIYHYYNVMKDSESADFTAVQTAYAVYNLSPAYEEFKKNFLLVKWVPIGKVFSRLFPNNEFLMKLKVEQKKEKEEKLKKYREAFEKKQKKERFIFWGEILGGVLILLIIISRIFRLRKQKRGSFDYKRADKDFLSEIYRMKQKDIDRVLSDQSILSLLESFSSEFRIPLKDMVLINSYIEEGSEEKGFSALSDMCRKYGNGIVFASGEGDYVILYRKKMG